MARKILLIVDAQNDFYTGGALACNGSESAAAAINELLKNKEYDAVFATADWHTKDSVSFKQNGGLWQEHCVGGTKGAELIPVLNKGRIDGVLHKGQNADMDNYSLFTYNDGTVFELWRGIFMEDDEVDICGFAFDYCVSATAKDMKTILVRGGVRVIENACAYIAKETVDKAKGEMLKSGIEVI